MKMLYTMWTFPYFSSGTMYTGQCQQEGCEYETGKDSESGAHKRILAHLKDKHGIDTEAR